MSSSESLASDDTINNGSVHAFIFQLVVTGSTLMVFFIAFCILRPSHGLIYRIRPKLVPYVLRKRLILVCNGINDDRGVSSAIQMILSFLTALATSICLNYCFTEKRTFQIWALTISRGCGSLFVYLKGQSLTVLVMMQPCTNDCPCWE